MYSTTPCSRDRKKAEKSVGEKDANLVAISHNVNEFLAYNDAIPLPYRVERALDVEKAGNGVVAIPSNSLKFRC